VNRVENTTRTRKSNLQSNTMSLKVVFVTILLLEIHFGAALPKPQSTDTEYDDVYGDYEFDPNRPATSDGPDLGDLLSIGAGLAKTFGDLLSQKELQSSLHRSLGAGLNLTGEVLKVAVPAVGGALGTVLSGGSEAISATRTIVSDPKVQERVGSVAAAGGSVVQGLGQVVSMVPRVLGQGARFAGSVVMAANETAPLVVAGFQDFQEQLPLITGFAQAYAEVNAEQAQKVTRTFQRSLECNLECGDLAPGAGKNRCEAEHCVKIVEEDEV